MPITPPFAAILRMASSVLQRGCPGTSARQFECVIRAGRLVASNASSVVRSPQCDVSTAIPALFMRSTIARPKSESPSSRRSVDAVADQIPCVVGELRHPLAGRVERVHVVRGAEVLGVLDPEEDADSP